MTELPVARVDVVSETPHGVTLSDPYRWMESGAPEFQDWIAGQAKYTDEYLAAQPLREELGLRISELTATTDKISGFSLAGDRVFYQRQSPGHPIPALMVREQETERTLLDPATMTGNEHYSLDWFAPNPAGTLVVCGLSQGGSENATAWLLDVATGELTDTGISEMRYVGVSWLPDGSGFLYHRYPDPTPDLAPADRRKNSHTHLRTLDGDDRLLLVRGLNPRVPLEPIDRPFVILPAASDHAIAVISHGALSNSTSENLSPCTFYAAPHTALTDPANCPWQPIAGPEDGIKAWAVHGDTIYLVSHANAPRSEIIAASLTEPGRREVVVPGGERAIAGVRVIGEHLVIRDVDGGIARLRRIPLAGGAPDEIPLPFDGYIEEMTASGGDLLVVLTSWTHTPRAYRYDGTTLVDTGWIPPSPVDLSDIEVTYLRAPARDGVLIPLAIAHRPGIELDGSNPALLTGYGSYGLLDRRRFQPELLAWFERGGIWAVAGLRGGGEYGPEWHAAGRGPNKEKTITDFIDCAEYLIKSGYTSSAHLGGNGGSAGGIPTGGALVRRPELFGAMVMQVPVTHATRMEFTDNGPINTLEFGSVTTPDGLSDLLIIDSYLRVEDGTSYPAVLITAGMNDSRVAAWQPAKMAARLQAATSSANPVLLRVDFHAGHGYGATREQRNALTADLYTFLLSALR